MSKVLIAILFLTFTTNFLICQTPCPLPLDCVDKFYPYKFCKNGIYIIDCSSLPNNNNDFKPLKNKINCTNYDFGSYTNLPFIIEKIEIVVDWSPVIGTITDTNNPDYGKDYYGFDSNGDHILDKYKIGEHTETKNINIGNNRQIYYDDNDPNSGIIFDINKVSILFNEALNEWKSLSCEFTNTNCYQSNNVTNCCTNVKWSDKHSDFIIDNIDYSSRASAYSITNVTPDCKRACQGLTIYINQTNQYTGYDENGQKLYIKNYFITDDNASESRWISIKAVFLHELGHILGFSDQYTDTGLLCPSIGSIMGGQDDSWHYMSKDLIEDDICMYKKLYCWSPLSDVENNLVLAQGVQIFPNPVNTDILNLQFSNPEFKNMSYQIISQIGDIVLKGNIKAEETLKTIELNTLSNGNYILIISSNGNQESKKFVVNK